MFSGVLGSSLCRRKYSTPMPALPGLNVDGIAMREDGRVLCRNGPGRFERPSLEDEDAADGHGSIFKRPRRHQNAVARHLLDVGHVGGLDAPALRFSERFASRVRTLENHIIAGRLAGSGNGHCAQRHQDGKGSPHDFPP